MNLETVAALAERRGFVQVHPASVHPALACALAALVETDGMLIERGAHERSICHRLAVHLEPWLRVEGWHVDCEYNLRKAELKRLDGNRVYPDLIVHRRDRTENLLVVEMKVLRPSTRPASIERDLQRLQDFHSSLDYRYQHGVFVVLQPGRPGAGSDAVTVFAPIPKGPDQHD